MPPDDFEEYLQFLAAVLRVRQARREEIFSELRDHFAERLAELQGQGADRERAAALAMQEFGDAAALAARFMQVIHQRRRRIVMRSTIGVISATFLVIVATLSFWPNAHGPGLTPAEAQDKPQNPAAASGENPFGEGPAGGPKTPAESLLTSAERDAATREILAEVADADFNETPLQDVLNYLKDYVASHAQKKKTLQFYVKRRSLEELGVSTDAPVTFNLKNIPLSMILHLILQEQGLDYTIQEGVVIITSPQDIESQTITKVYNLQHWLKTTLSPAEEEKILQIITDSINPPSWDVYGGHGSIRSFVCTPLAKTEGLGYGRLPIPPGIHLPVTGKEGAEKEGQPPRLAKPVPETKTYSASENFPGIIVVNQTPAIHERISDLLNQLRDAQLPKGGI